MSNTPPPEQVEYVLTPLTPRSESPITPVAIVYERLPEQVEYVFVHPPTPKTEVRTVVVSVDEAGKCETRKELFVRRKG